jgi:membrane protein YqaA with SNARE-associated domain
LKQRFKKWLQVLQCHAGSWWYVPAISLLAFADLFLVVIPTDGLLISSAMLTPRRWVYTATAVALGSSLGALALAHVLHTHGLSLLLQISPGIDQSQTWAWTTQQMGQWGGWALFGIALSPILQHPAVAIAAFAGMPESRIFALVFAGRLLKYLFLAWLATHAPKLLTRLWGLKHELDGVGVKPEKPNQT